jgi:cytochrome c
MDNFELTKIAGAVLAALLLIFGTKTFVEMRSEHGASETPGYTLPAAEAKADAKAAPAKAEGGKDAAGAPADKKSADAPKDAAAAPAAGGNPGAETVALLGKANADNGKAIFAKCKSCHVAEKGKTSTVGPNLWGVVNRPRASYEGFSYSDGMKAKGGSWSFEEIGNFLNNPKGYVQGTKMVFNGLPAASDRADVISYLATLADTPVALPK